METPSVKSVSFFQFFSITLSRTLLHQASAYEHAQGSENDRRSRCSDCNRRRRSGSNLNVFVPLR